MSSSSLVLYGLNSGSVRLLAIASIFIRGKSSNTDEKRPLGIPTMYERALQALVKLALEPEWEAKFEPNSYGFRPARSAHDAIGAIYISINKKPKYVLDADISKCGSSLPFMLNQHTRCQDNILLTQKLRKFLKP